MFKQRIHSVFLSVTYQKRIPSVLSCLMRFHVTSKQHTHNVPITHQHIRSVFVTQIRYVILETYKFQKALQTINEYVARVPYYRNVLEALQFHIVYWVCARVWEV